MMLPRSACPRLAAGMALMLAMSAALAADPGAAPKLVLSEDGTEVINVRAGLAWSRCVEGMRWSGKTCTGEPKLLDHAQAIAAASARSKAEDLHWRMPRVTELQRLVDRTARSPGLDPALFPAAPQDWHWVGTANVRTSQVNQYNYGNIMQGRSNESANHMAFLHGWAVNTETAEARGDTSKRLKLPVRLVRRIESP